MRFIASSNIAFNSIDNDFLRAAFEIFDSTFTIPGRDKIRNELINLSKTIHDDMLNELSGETVSLLFDGCHRWAEEYQGVIVFTRKRLYVWGLISVNDSKSKTIAEMISSIVDTLSDFSITVVSACCDNCKSNVKALNQDEDSAQEMCQSSFIRQPCSAHTANLGIKDLFSKNKKYNYVKKAIKKLMSNKPEGSFRLGFEPKLETIRWKSLFKCVSFINENYELYEKSNNFEVLDSLYTIKEIIGWHNLNEVLKIVWDFIKKVEKDLSSIDQIVPPYINARTRLIEMNIPLSIDMANALHNRFLYTCPLQLPIFAFLLTNEGLYYYRRFYEEDSEFVDAAINGMVCYQIERDIDADVIEINCNAFKDYLEIFNIERFSSFSDVLEMWEFYEKNDPEIGIPTSFFTLAKEVLQIPSSEAAVERLFTFLSDLTSNKMCNSKEQTL